MQDDPLATLEAWRAQAATPPDAVGWAVLQGMARRAAQQRGEARQWLLKRMAERWAGMAVGTSPQAMAGEQVVEHEPMAAAPITFNWGMQRDAMKGLIELVARLNRSGHVGDTTNLEPAAKAAPGAATAKATAAAPLHALAAYQSTWSRLRAEQRLRQALEQVPAQAGPLNSSQVVHQALQAMHAASPEYLDAFMRHADALMWLEQAMALPVAPPKTSAKPRAQRPVAVAAAKSTPAPAARLKVKVPGPRG